MKKLSPGDKAPEFTLQDQKGSQINISDFKGQKVLIYFYPKANTPGCTKQACNVRDNLPDLKKLNIAALGISPDKADAQDKFDVKYNLNFPLLADEDHSVAESFGVWGEKSMYGKKYMGIIRSSFLIDEKGFIQKAWYKVKPLDTVPNVLNLEDF